MGLCISMQLHNMMSQCGGGGDRSFMVSLEILVLTTLAKQLDLSGLFASQGRSVRPL